MVQILVFGDSITYGVWDKYGGWVQKLRKFLDEKTLSKPETYFLIYNLGISGGTVEDLLERFEFETKQRLKENEGTIFIFAQGINDSQYVHSQKNLRCPPQKFQRNLQTLINLAKKFSSTIVFLGLTPVDESKVDPMPWNIDRSYKNKNVKTFNDIIKSICNGNAIFFIEIYKNLVKTDYKRLLEDGAHPNSDGHQKIFEIVKEFLVENGII